jgi:hypothetical protein
MNAVAAGYLDTLGIPLLQGRMLNEHEIEMADRVAVINEAASRLWPAGENPIGRRIRLNELEKPSRPDILTPANASPFVTIVGLVGNTRNDDLRTEKQPVVIIPYTLLAPPGRTLAIRAQNNPKMLVSALRAQVREMDSEQPLYTALTFDEILGFRTAQPRFTMVLFSLFAALGLMLTLAVMNSVVHLVSMRPAVMRQVALGSAAGRHSS